VNAVLLRPLPYRDPERLALIGHYRPNYGGRDFATGADFLDWRDQAKAFEQIAAYTFDSADLTGNGEPERLDAGMVSASLFATLGVAPALGRAFTPEEDTLGGPGAVILSDGLWRRRFGGDPEVIGRAITLGNQSRTVVGIMPPGFRFPGESDLWLPIALDVPQELGRQHMLHVSVLARLKSGVTLDAARSDLSVILARLRQAFPGHYAEVQVRVTALGESLVSNV